MAAGLDDLLIRRTRLAFIDRAGGLDGGSASELLAGELGWSAGETNRQIARYRSVLERERGRPLQ